ncbi:MAG: outer membrane protein assembly factor BamE [Holosporales bacterium]
MSPRAFSILSLTVVGTLSACAPRVAIHGHMPEPEQISALQPGQQSKEDVLRLLGSPCSATPLDEKEWIYFHKKTETTAFMHPTTVEQQLLCLQFDEKGILQNIDVKDGRGQQIAPQARRTPTHGEDRPFLQRIFGNFGRHAKTVGAREDSKE